MKKNKFLSTNYFVYKSSEKRHQLPVLMIHGHGGSHIGLRPVARLVSAEVVIPDLPGYGESGELECEHTIENYAKHLKRLVDHVGYKQYAVVGHSLGSAIVLGLAATDKRVKKIILINPVPVIKPSVQKLIRSVGKLGLVLPESMADSSVNSTIYDLGAFFLHSRRRNDFRHAKGYIEAQSTTRYSFKTWSQSGESFFLFDHVEAAASIAVPSLILHGGKDSMTGIADMRLFSEALGAKIEILPQAGHLMPIENYNQVAAVANNFLEEDSLATDNKLFTVIIPCLNENGTVQMLLNQLLDQKSYLFDIIAVDNSSSDGTDEIITHYEKQGVIAITRIKRGVSRARNVGAKRANSKWLVFLDADTQLPPDFADKLTDLLLKKPRFSMAALAYRTNTKNLFYKLLTFSGQFYQRMGYTIAKKPLVPGAVLVIKRSLHEKINGFNESIHYNEDFEYAARAYRARPKFKSLRQPYVYFSTRRLESGGWIKMTRVYLRAELARLRGREYIPDNYDMSSHKMR